MRVIFISKKKRIVWLGGGVTCSSEVEICSSNSALNTSRSERLNDLFDKCDAINEQKLKHV